MLPGTTTASQQATIKYFVIVALMFFAQVLVGGATAHYRADAGSFYGIDISGWLPRSEEHTSELQSPCNLVCRLLLEKKTSRHNTVTQVYAHNAMLAHRPKQTAPLAESIMAHTNLFQHMPVSSILPYNFTHSQTQVHY